LPRVTAPLSVTVVLPELLTVNEVAFVWTFIVPVPEASASEGVNTPAAVAVIVPAPSVVRLANAVGLRATPIVIEPLEPGAVVRLTVLAASEPAVVILPEAVTANVLAVDAAKLTEPLLLTVTLPVVLALSDPAPVWTLISPQPEATVNDGAETMPPVPVIVPIPSAVRFADTVALMFAPIHMLPAVPGFVVRMTLLAAIKPLTVISASAFTKNVLPLDAPMLTGFWS